MLTEDGLILMLARLETNAVKASENYKLYDGERRRRVNVEDDNRRCDMRVATLERDLKDAENKIAEWATYGEHLRRMLKQRKVLDEKLPTIPTTLDADIPF